MISTSGAPAEREGRVLVLAPAGRDGPLTQKALAAAGLDAHVTSPLAVGTALAQGAGALILTEEALSPNILGRVRAHIRAQPAWSDLPVLVVVSKRPDDSRSRAFHEQVLALGNVTLLERPLNPRSLVSAVASALRARRRQYEARDLLARVEGEVERRDQFLAMLGHELRNPLGAIRNVTELLLRTIPPEAKTERYLAALGRQTRNLTRMVDDLLEVSRVSAGKVTLKRARLALGPLVEGVVQQLGAIAEQHRLSLSFRDASMRLEVEGDQVRLDQIFGNLITNAIKYTPEGGCVEVVVEQAGDMARVRVRDDGVGIAAEMLPHLFDLFCQAEKTLDRSQGGMGVGLTLARRLVELHGGTIEAHSRGLGFGSVFTVDLPLAKGRTQEDARKALTVSPGGAGRRVLVVEDSPDNRETMRDLLECFGHQVDVAADGLQALERLVTFVPEVAVVDIGLPGLDGYEVARRARTALKMDVYLIALTGYGQSEDVARASSAGFDAHLTKPADIETLRRLIESPRVGR